MNSSVDATARISPVIVRLTPQKGDPFERELARRLAEIDLVSNAPPWNEDLFLEEFRCEGVVRVYAARLRGSIVGFLVAHVVLDEAHIMNFGVDPIARGQGVGNEILSEFLLQSVEEGIRSITLEVRRSNDVAQHLYRKYGFVDVGVRARYYRDNQEDALILALLR
jgi:ribosomal-protein-alanine N-acetyltransferase